MSKGRAGYVRSTATPLFGRCVRPETLTLTLRLRVRQRPPAVVGDHHGAYSAEPWGNCP